MDANGSTNELRQALERLIAVLTRVSDGVGTLLERLHRVSESFDDSSERHEREHEKILESVRDLEKIVLVISERLDEARDDIEKVREDTDPRIRLQAEAAREGKHDEHGKSGKLVALARLAEKVPTPWVALLLKSSVLAAAGAGLLRFLQWMTHGR